MGLMQRRGRPISRPEPTARTAHPSRLGIWAALAAAALSVGCLKTPDRYVQSSLDVKQNPPANFELDGKPFCFAGSNNYYPIFKPKPVVDDLFEAARALDLKVMRVWGMLDRGSLDGSVPNTDGEGHKQGVYFQYWDPVAKKPAYNDGENGLVRLDYVLAAAAKNDIKVIVVLINNWRAFGGIDQYLTWYGKNKHHEFFTEPELKQAYRNWVKHVVTRVNTINGRKYREDPTVFAWELANEPRCKGGASFDSATGWDKSTLTSWADEMSHYIKSLDSNHLVSVGDEGFLDGGGDHWAYKANDGVDHAALTALPNIDFGTFHLYPEDWTTPEGFGEQAIAPKPQVVVPDRGSDHHLVGAGFGGLALDLGLDRFGRADDPERAMRLDDLGLVRGVVMRRRLLGRHQLANVAGVEQRPAQFLRARQVARLLVGRRHEGRQRQDGVRLGECGGGGEGLAIGREGRSRRRLAEMGRKGIADTELSGGLGAGAA